MPRSALVRAITVFEALICITHTSVKKRRVPVSLEAAAVLLAMVSLTARCPASLAHDVSLQGAVCEDISQNCAINSQPQVC